MQDQALQGFPLSQAQRRLWLLGETGVDSQTSGRVALSGPLDPERLRTAIAAVVLRHEILRTTFRRLPGMTLPLQIIDPEPRFSFLGTEPGEPAGSGEAPPLQVRLRTIGEGEHEIDLALPALCCDGASLALLIGEIAARYAGEDGGAEEVTQYADFAQWQADRLAEPELAPQREFWRRLAPAVRGAARLPGGSAPAPAAAYRPATRSLALAPTLVRELRALAAQRGTPLASVLLAGWQVLLHRFTGAGELVIAVAYDGRSFDELREAVGPYERFLPLRLAGAPELSFAEILAAGHDLAADVGALQEGFAEEDLAGGGEVGSPTVLPFAFAGASVPQHWRAGGLAFRLLALDRRGDRFEARLTVAGTGDRIRLELCHDAGRLDGATAALLLERLAVLLASAAARPSAPLSELAALSAGERHRLIAELNDTERALGPAACLHELFFAQARATPEAIALIAETGTLTFAELALRARRLAAYLARLGVTLESRVALCADRTPEAVIGILGILAAGGCYVPLDPAYPAERLAFLLADSQPQGVLTLERHLDALSPLPIPVLCLDRDAAAIAAADLAAPASTRPPTIWRMSSTRPAPPALPRE